MTHTIGRMGKANIISDIARLAGIPDPGLGVGSSVYKALFDGVCERFGIDSSGSMPDQAKRIVEAAGMPYVSAFDSTTTPSGGGSTVTENGLLQIKTAVQRLIDFER